MSTQSSRRDGSKSCINVVLEGILVLDKVLHVSSRHHFCGLEKWTNPILINIFLQPRFLRKLAAGLPQWLLVAVAVVTLAAAAVAAALVAAASLRHRRRGASGSRSTCQTFENKKIKILPTKKDK